MPCKRIVDPSCLIKKVDRPGNDQPRETVTHVMSSIINVLFYLSVSKYAVFGDLAHYQGAVENKGWPTKAIQVD